MNQIIIIRGERVVFDSQFCHLIILLHLTPSKNANDLLFMKLCKNKHSNWNKPLAEIPLCTFHIQIYTNMCKIPAITVEITIIEKLTIYPLISILLTTIHLFLLGLLPNDYDNFVSAVVYCSGVSYGEFQLTDWQKSDWLSIKIIILFLFLRNRTY